MMDRFDDLVTDRRLRRDELLAYVERLRNDELLHGRYRAMTTSGSSGRKGLFVYDEQGWTQIVRLLRYSVPWRGRGRTSRACGWPPSAAHRPHT